MKFIFFISVILACFAAEAQTKKDQQSFVLSGKLIGRDTGRIVLWYPDTSGKWIRDTIYLQNGKFQFSGYVGEPSICWLKGSTTDGNTAVFFLEPGKQHISVEENKFEDFIMFGSFTQKQYDTLKGQIKLIDEKYKDWNEEHKKLVKELKKTTDSLSRSKMEERITEIAEVLNKENRDLSIAFISTHPDSYVSPSELYSLMSGQLKTDSVERLYNNFSARIKNSRTGKLIKEELYKRKYHFKAPDFTAVDMRNEKLSLSGFKGKYVLLNFWASWCVPCIKEIPELKSFLSKYAGKGLEIIAISTDSNKESWIKAVKKYGVQNFQNVLANEEIRENYSNMTQPIPSQLLINRNGVVIWNSRGQPFKSLEGFLEKEFN